MRRRPDRSGWGRGRPGRLRRALGLARPTWHDRHPLPTGWKPRTRIDCYGREVEPWLYVVADAHGYTHDGGEWWLPMRMDPDQAAHEVLTHWLDHVAPDYLAPHEIAGLRVCARPAAYAGDRIGVAYAAEQALTG